MRHTVFLTLYSFSSDLIKYQHKLFCLQQDLLYKAMIITWNTFVNLDQPQIHLISNFYSSQISFHSLYTHLFLNINWTILIIHSIKNLTVMALYFAIRTAAICCLCIIFDHMLLNSTPQWLLWIFAMVAHTILFPSKRQKTLLFSHLHWWAEIRGCWMTSPEKCDLILFTRSKSEISNSSSVKYLNPGCPCFLNLILYIYSLDKSVSV